MIDHVQLSRLYAAHAAELLLYALQRLDRASAEDAVQEMFVRLAQRRTLPANPKAWLYRGLRNYSISLFRQHSRRTRREQRAAVDEIWFESSGEHWLDGAMAKSVLENLPVEQREVLVLRIWGQLTLKEISSLTRTPTSTVFDQYRIGLEALRKAMGVSCEINQ